MKHKKAFRLLTSLAAVVLCTTALSVTAFAGGGDETGEYYEWISEDPAAEETEPAAETEAEPLTPEGNMTLVDDIDGEAAGDKQFITVVTKNGNYFYIIIDRAEDGDNTVHFLNQVDEADLLALMEDGEQAAETPIVCTCTDKCVAGDVDTTCPVCATNMSECTGKESTAEPEDDAEPEPQEEQKSGTGALLAVLLVLIAGGGAAAYFLVLKPKQGKKVPSDPDDFDLEDEEEYLNEDETEDTE